jgi:hypothetical protein
MLPNSHLESTILHSYIKGEEDQPKFNPSNKCILYFWEIKLKFFLGPSKITAMNQEPKNRFFMEA